MKEAESKFIEKFIKLFPEEKKNYANLMAIILLEMNNKINEKEATTLGNLLDEFEKLVEENTRLKKLVKG